MYADDEVCLPTHAPPSVQASIPDSPCSSSAPDISTRLSTAHSLPQEDEEVKAPQAAPASSSSSLTRGNLDHLTASAAGKPPPSPSATSQPGGGFVTSHQPTQQQQQQPQQTSPVSLPKGQNESPLQLTTSQQQQQQQTSLVSLPRAHTVASPAQLAVDIHPLQADLQQPSATSAQEGVRNLQQAGTADDVQAQEQSLGTPGQAGDGEGLSGGAAFGAWASATQHSEWAVMEWVASEALPALIGAVRMVGPHTETEALRYLACNHTCSLFICSSRCCLFVCSLSHVCVCL